MIRYEDIEVTVSGTAGSASGLAVSGPVAGELLAVHVAYTDQPGTCDVTLERQTPSETLLTVADGNTDGWFYPRKQIQDNSGSPVTGEYEPYPVVGNLKVSVAQGDPGVVDLRVVYRE